MPVREERVSARQGLGLCFIYLLPIVDGQES